MKDQLSVDSICFLDFETRSLVDIKKVGASRYCQDPSTEILCLAYAFGMGEIKLWVKGQPPPKDLMDWIRRGGTVSGFNSLSFERAVFDYIAGPRLGWAIPKTHQYIDTMHDALALALPGDLERCALASGVIEKKDKIGKSLITKFCKPISSGKKKGQFRRRKEFSKEFALLYNYCKQDVRTERAIWVWMPRHVSGVERKVQLLTAKMNKRGVPIDLPAVQAIADTLIKYKEKLNAECKHLCGFSATQRDRVREWLEEQGFDLPNMQGPTVLEQLERADMPADAIRVLDIYSKVSKTSTAKYGKMLLQVCDDGRIRDNLIYHKASTGRYAGAGVQLQNLPRLSVYDPDFFIQLFKDGDIDALLLYDCPINIASALVRSMVKAEEGSVFFDSDLSKIEAIGTCWVAKEKKLLIAHENGLDNYKMSATGMFNITYEMVNYEQRQIGKITELAGGFGGGKYAIIAGAKKGGITLDEDTAEKWKKDFRRGRPNLTKSWGAFGSAAMQAVENPRTTIPVSTNNAFQFRYSGDFLYMSLPSGRLLSFPFPEVGYVTWKKDKDGNARPHVSKKQKGNSQKVVTAMWIDSKSHQWTRRGIIGANFFQSAVQSMCRDVLMEAHLRIEDDGWPMYMSVHDESVSMVPDQPQYTQAQYDRLMVVRPEWLADNFPLRSDGWKGYRYKKDG